MLNHSNHNSLFPSPNGALSREILAAAISAANQEVMELLTKSKDEKGVKRRGPYQKYTPKDKQMIGTYALMHRASVHFTCTWVLLTLRAHWSVSPRTGTGTHDSLTQKRDLVSNTLPVSVMLHSLSRLVYQYTHVGTKRALQVRKILYHNFFQIVLKLLIYFYKNLIHHNLDNFTKI